MKAEKINLIISTLFKCTACFLACHWFGYKNGIIVWLIISSITLDTVKSKK